MSTLRTEALWCFISTDSEYCVGQLALAQVIRTLSEVVADYPVRGATNPLGPPQDPASAKCPCDKGHFNNKLSGTPLVFATRGRPSSGLANSRGNKMGRDMPLLHKHHSTLLFQDEWEFQNPIATKPWHDLRAKKGGQEFQVVRSHVPLAGVAKLAEESRQSKDMPPSSY